MKTVFVTGGTGFIGKNIIEFLRERTTVLAPSHAQLDLLSHEDVNQFFRQNEIDCVINCASIGGNRKSRDVPDTVAKNLRMFFNLAHNSQHFERLIHFGSGAEYDKSRPLSHIKESSFGEYIPKDDYGFSKYLISNFIERADNMVCLRLFGVFGKYEDYDYKFISNAILKNLLQLPIRIQQNVFFDWIYINDLLRILQHFLEIKLRYAAYNITPNDPMDLVSIAHKINDCSPNKSDIIVVNPGLNFEYSGDNTRLSSEIGDFSFISMSDAILELREYYLSILDRIDADVIERDEYIQYCIIRPDQ